MILWNWILVAILQILSNQIITILSLNPTAAVISNNVWTPWYSISSPSGNQYESETLVDLRRTYPQICPTPSDVHCRVQGTNTTSDKSGDIFVRPCSTSGIICDNKAQRLGYCQNYELQFLCPSITNACTSGNYKCDANAQCINSYGGYICRCNRGYYGNGKTCFKTGKCVAHGDPHYATFDGQLHNFMGICNYILSASCPTSPTSSLNQFQVIVSNEYRGNNRIVSYTRQVSVVFGNTTITMATNGVLAINGVPAQSPNTFLIGKVNVSIEYTTQGYEVSTDFGLFVSFDGNSRAVVQIDQSYKGNLCGLCGNFDGNATNDWKAPSGTMMNDDYMWGQSWIAAIQDDANCNKLVTGGPTVCNSVAAQIAGSKCGIITSSTGPFAQCHSYVDPTQAFSDCYYDVCADSSDQALFCDAVHAYATLCNNEGVLLQWMAQAQCIFPCGPNQVFSANAPGCQDTCTNPQASVTCYRYPAEGCVCNEGYLLSGSQCVSKDQCGCIDSTNQYHTIGDVWFSNNCTTKQTCIAASNIVTNNHVQCDTFGECVITVDGDMACRCKKGYEGKPDNCTAIDYCSSNNNACNQDAQCHNQGDGTYTCSCMSGFEGDGFTCTNIDECKLGTDNCSDYATCADSFGSFVCTCINGYEGDGIFCEPPVISGGGGNDSTGCSFYKTILCHPMASCDDSGMSIVCSCPEGALGDGMLGVNHTGCAYPACPPNFQMHGAFCYKFTNTTLTQTNAMTQCQNLGASLATLSSDDVISFVRQQMATYGYTGLVWVGYDNSRYAPYYLPYDYAAGNLDSYWSTGEPNVLTRNCVALQQSVTQSNFVTKACNTTYQGLCKLPTYKLSCPDGWLGNDIYCYTTFSKQLTYTKAILQCAKYGADLAILDASTSKFVHDNFLALSDNNYWIGLNRQITKRFYWLNGERISWYNWESEDAMNGLVVAVSQNATWTSYDLTSTQGSLCQKARGILYSCPVGSEYFNSTCYKLNTTALTYSDALSNCRAMGGDLVSINNLYEQKFVEDYVFGQIGIQTIWIGLSFQSATSAKWTDNSSLVMGSDYFYNTSASNFVVNIAKNITCGKAYVNSTLGGMPWAVDTCSQKYASLCQYTNTPCQNDSNCNVNGQCNLGQCRCKSGYKGDGLTQCTDINECLNTTICNVNSEVCINLPGSYVCNCTANYVRYSDGVCKSILFCNGDADCARNGNCYKNLCQCQTGYGDNGKLNCTDNNECLLGTNNCDSNATCTNLPGGFSCTCNSGYQGNGVTCTPIPKTCHEIFLSNPKSTSKTYTIDPDGVGPFPPITASCVFTKTMGITQISHTLSSTVKFTSSVPEGDQFNVVYGVNLTSIRAIITNSPYCYQSMSYQSQGGIDLILNGGYLDALGIKHKSWGGSSVANQCLCGNLGYCVNRTNGCNNDGTTNSATTPLIDDGNLSDRSQLPITQILGGGIKSGLAASFQLSALMCGPKQFNIPLNCDDQKFNYKDTSNGVTMIDIDGPDGNLLPFLVYCDMTSYTHVGVTVIPHKLFNGRVPATGIRSVDGPLYPPGGNPASPNYPSAPVLVNGNTININYLQPMTTIQNVINALGYCKQEVDYGCTNSRILNGYGYLTSGSGKNLTYWAGGQGNMCACGVLGRCDQSGYNCNCQIQDGVARHDFGWIQDKADLPIASVTLNDIGGAGQAYSISFGNLECASLQFGVEPTCQGWRYRGYNVDYVYPIDTDGPSATGTTNNPAYLAQCDMTTSPQIGVTIIPASQNVGVCSESLCTSTVTYSPTAPSSQPTTLPVNVLNGLTARSSYCHQEIKFKCQNSVVVNINSSTYWTDIYGAKHKYYHGSSDLQPYCKCHTDGSCVKNCLCATSSNTLQVDDNFLMNKDQLPLVNIVFLQATSKTAINQVLIGDLYCYEIFPTCNDLANNFIPTTELSLNFPNGYYTIDVDQDFGMAPFEVTCQFPTMITSVEIDSGFPIKLSEPGNVGANANCTTVNYHNGVTLAQLKGLAAVSGFCLQLGSYQCQYTPLTGYVSWYDVDGSLRPGWAGNNGGSMCACGQVQSCSNGSSVACNCDDSSASQDDRGVWIDKNILPVSKLCYGLSSVAAPKGKKRSSTITLGSLRCGPGQFDIYQDCQDFRDNWKNDNYVLSKTTVISTSWIVDPDASGSLPPLTVFCNMSSSPPFGITQIQVQSSSACSTQASAVTVTPQYLGASSAQIQALQSESRFCEQTVTYQCNNAPLKFNAAKGLGAVAANNMVLSYWGNNTGGTGCYGGACNCDAMDSQSHSDSGKFLDPAALPLSAISLPTVTGQRNICIGPLMCYKLFRTCDEISQGPTGYNKPLGTSEYAIDPDQAGGQPPFSVSCSMNGLIGVTTPYMSSQNVSSGKTSFDAVVTYTKPTTLAQIRALIDVSGYCAQSLDYTCNSVALLANSQTYIIDQTGNPSPFWAGADAYNTKGCPCTVLGTCPTGQSCRCDAKSSVTDYEGSVVTNLGLLPITGIHLGSIPSGLGIVVMGTLSCAPQSYGLYKHCDDGIPIPARRKELLVQPTANVAPFLVSCDYSGLYPITIIPSAIQNVQVTSTTTISYVAASPAQAASLVSVLSYCSQPIKIGCIGTKISDGTVTLNGNYGAPILKMAGSTQSNKCACGSVGLCGGNTTEPLTTFSTRACNCDYADQTPRRDAGTITTLTANNLPLVSVSVNTAVATNVQITVGPLQCAKSAFNVDECGLNFHDCDVHATCADTVSSYTCTCNPGWNGLGGYESFATGRLCPDDNECALNKCPNIADCVNIPGSYLCNCKSGFQQVTPTTCADVDECVLGTHTCDVNARCVNTFGSYTCACNPGYRGNGFAGNCYGIGTCRCFGDPHCQSFDGTWLHYQGSCKYTMLRDNCINGYPNGSPTFQIVQKNWRQGIPAQMVSWVKELTVQLSSTTIMLKLQDLVTINGQRVTLPVSVPIEGQNPVNIYLFGNSVRLSATYGLDITWDGVDSVQIDLSQEFNTKVCGLCGNFNNNPSDDWVIGPQCTPRGNLTLLNNLFGDSWRDDNPPDTDPDCQPVCTSTGVPDTQCSASATGQATTECTKLINLFNSTCGLQMAKYNVNINDYLIGCIYDYCHAAPSNQSAIICNTGNTISTKCQADYNVTVNWRSTNFCSYTCSSGLQYSRCTSPCQPTCQTMNIADNQCATTCVEGCICPNGTVMDRGKCINPQSCGCTYSGYYYSVGDSFVLPNCTQKLQCTTPGGPMKSTTQVCNSNAFCGFQNNEYNCYCNSGYTGNGINCTDINECTVNKPCDANATCTNLPGSYSCSCKMGYYGNGVTCQKNNPCLNTTAPVCNSTVSECHTTDTNYQCQCLQGFTMLSGATQCTDKNECTDGTSQCDKVSTNCINTFGSYACNCKSGFTPTSNSMVCNDVNECTSSTSNNCNSQNATCSNTVGSYYCTCLSGYQGDGKICLDIDECKNSSTVCQANAVCVNDVPGYHCHCIAGTMSYASSKSNGTNCASPDPCSDVVCQPLAECNNGYCNCIKGYVLDMATHSCKDDNECLTGNNDCSSRNAICNNTIGSYECSCLEGYEFTSNSKNCTNINECDRGWFNCSKHAKCVDTQGAYYCVCDSGYTGHCDQCNDINECAIGTPCGSASICINRPGSYDCECKSGYKLSTTPGDNNCYDMDECNLGLSDCNAPKMTCTNIGGSFLCGCQTGYQLTADGKACEDENECGNSNNRCPPNAFCTNTDGSYTCQCSLGYFGDGQTCIPKNKPDGDSCADLYCDVNAVCVNLICQCISGFTGNGSTCEDINECGNGAARCDVNAKCYNIPGSFICICDDGYIGDGSICQKDNAVDLCVVPGFCVGGACSNNICSCEAGFTLQQHTCTDDDECSLGTNKCDDTQVCNNKPGGYDCTCKSGYEVAGTTSCQDIDECSKGNNNCKRHSICINNPGSYSCQCAPGYTAAADGSGVCTKINDGSCQQACPAGAHCKSKKCVCADNLVQSKTDPTTGALQCTKTTPDCATSPCNVNAKCTELAVSYQCTCNPGFQGDGVNCELIDACAVGIDNCDRLHGACVSNHAGNFSCICNSGYNMINGVCTAIVSCTCNSHGKCVDGTCECDSGYQHNALTGTCNDVNECNDPNACHIYAKCTNLPGSYSCQCRPNYNGDGIMFCDLDECATGQSNCSPNSVCVDVVGGFTCNCSSGYIKDANGNCVTDINPCLINNGNCGVAVCLYKSSVKTCVCKSGYTGDGTACIDVNECLEGNDCDQNAMCFNFDGGYACQCFSGYEGSGLQCTDVNECNTVPSICAQHATCYNTLGNYECTCDLGYTGDGRIACTMDSTCSNKGGCHPLATCLYKNGIYQCVCRSGFNGDGVHACDDIDECQLRIDNCLSTANCSNLPGTYNCSCSTGYVGDGIQVCLDVNECSPKSNPCDPQLQVCVNSPGSYDCRCSSGAVPDDENLFCKDIDECSDSSRNNCSPNAVCSNTIGSYSCDCKNGYYGDGVTCLDIDECALGTANCSINALCTNKPGSFDCECQAGTHGDGYNCIDPNPCSDLTSPLYPCDINATCTPLNPGYICECNEGFLGTGYFCIQPSPCDLPGACSDPNMICMVGDFNEAVCNCPKGSQLIKGVCSSFNPCAADVSPCNPNTQNCRTNGNSIVPKCECKDGYKMKRGECTDKDECDKSSPDYAAVKCHTVGGGTCKNTPGGFTCSCAAGSKCASQDISCAVQTDCSANAVCRDTHPGHTCTCASGFDGDGFVCNDINECTAKTAMCNDNSECTNTEGSYTCACLPGFSPDFSGYNCNDINECSVNPTICGSYAKCINTIGSYKCSCIKGYNWNATSNQCTDIDECSTPENPCHVNAVCTNLAGTCKCKCKSGFTGDGRYNCQETDSCPTKISSRCPSSTYCTNNGTSTGQPTCQCLSGYIASRPATCNNGLCITDCDDVDECITKKKSCDQYAKCVNTNGTFKCTCPSYLQGDGLHCHDIDECATGTANCPEMSVCNNLDNTVDPKFFQCTCNPGYTEGFVPNSCIDINECLSPTSVCDVNADCTNYPGTYSCECHVGYEPVDRVCTDIDECSRNLHDCDTTSTYCINDPGSYHCTCISGYVPISGAFNTTCSQIDICNRMNPCAYLKTNYYCVNFPTGFSCGCYEGYTNATGICQDINECTEYSATCDASAICINSLGSFNCECSPGKRMRSDGVCEGINECIEMSSPCDSGLRCYDRTPGYECICLPGYTHPDNDFTTCIDVNECLINSYHCSVNSHCVNIIGAYDCDCNQGYTLVSDNCTDIDECQNAINDGNPLCGSIGYCTNTLGSFTCTCPSGYLLQNNSCQDIDECTLPLGASGYVNCTENGTCKNLPGTFLCDCDPGYNYTGTTCEDVNECDAYDNICQDGMCVNQPGTYQCYCSQGFILYNGVCHDVNECEDVGICGAVNTAVCINKPGTYECHCFLGYNHTSPTEICSDANDCLNQAASCGPNSNCIDQLRGYLCECIQGYEKNSNGICIDVDECLTGEDNCLSIAECHNTVGSYDCFCPHGFIGDGKSYCNPVCGENVCASYQICRVNSNNQPVCSCDCIHSESCSTSGKVCDNTGETHNSEKNMREISCNLGVVRTVDYYSECKKSCDDVNCPRHQVCSMINNIPTCNCIPCTAEERVPQKLCSNRDIQYDSKCQFKDHQCLYQLDDVIAYLGPCKRSIDCKLSGWSDWSPCDQTCDVGHRSRTRSVIRGAKFGGSCDTLKSVEQCTLGPCPDSLCATLLPTCPPYSLCNAGKCFCPNCDNSPTDPVCVIFTGTFSVTYPNLCSAQRYACLNNLTYTFVHQGACGDYTPEEPADCKSVVDYRYLTTDDNCKSQSTLQLNKCAGGCGSDPSQCCKATEFSTVFASFLCPDGTTVQRQINTTTACNCGKDEFYVAPIKAVPQPIPALMPM